MKIDGKKAIKKVAKKNGVSVEEVRAQMEIAIEEGMRNPNPKIREYWNKIPYRGEKPTPEEVIKFLIKARFE